MTTETQSPKLIDRVEGVLQRVAAEPCACILCDEARGVTGGRCKACEAIDLLQKFIRVRVR